MPVLNLNKKLGTQARLNFKLEAREVFYKNENWSIQHELVDLVGVYSHRVGLTTSLAGGILLRYRGDEFFYRSIQQFVKRTPSSNFSITHRFVADQTFAQGYDPELRFRYRISGQRALSGAAIDRGEFYIKASNEYLNAFQGDDYGLEVRVLFGLGFKFKAGNKLELNLDNRLDSFLQAKRRLRSWAQIGWYISI